MARTIAAPHRHAGGRTVAVAASAVAHAGLFLLLAWRLGEAPARPEPPAMVVQLMPRPPRPEAEPEARKAPPQADPADRERRPVAARPSLPPPPGLAVPAPAPLAVDEAAGAQALRGLLDCRPANLDRLTPDARERCERRLAGDPALRAASGPRLNLDASGRYGRDDEPYLARRPKTGCKVRAAGGVDPMGRQGAVGGVACAIPF